MGLNFSFMKSIYQLPHSLTRGSILIVLLLIFGFSKTPMAYDINLILNPNENAPLVGILTFKTDKPVVPTLFITDGKNEQTVTPDNEPATNHEILVLGLRPGRVHDVLVTIKSEDGQESTLDSLQIETPPLPDDFPPIELTTYNPDKMEPGVTMVSLYRWEQPYGPPNLKWGVAAALDHQGEVVWYVRLPFLPNELRRMRNGNVFISSHTPGQLWELDMKGNLVNEWLSEAAVTDDLKDESIIVKSDRFHHDVIELPSQNLMALSAEVREYENFPLESLPGTKSGVANLAGDVIIEFEPNGNTVREWSVLDLLDPERIGEGSFATFFYKNAYKDRYDPLPIDIYHSNALYYVEDEDALIVSSKHQCAIYKIDLKSKELIWILGDPIGWNKPWSEKLLKPKGDLTWPCHQHGIEMTPRGNLLLYDNGAGRFIPPQTPMPSEERYSRVVQYRIDEEAGTVEEVWVYGPEQEFFMSPFICDADYLPETGNILITDGGHMTGKDGKPVTEFREAYLKWGRVMEVTYDGKEKVWELVMKHPEIGFSIFRGQRFRSLYPKLDVPSG